MLFPKRSDPASAEQFGKGEPTNHELDQWTNKELDGLVALEVQGQTRILPIWHKVSKDEVARYSPTLADKVALNTSLKSVEEIAGDLMSLIQD